jgi:hypothetical protein
MAKHRTHSIEFKRQVVQPTLDDETRISRSESTERWRRRARQQ